MRLRWGKKQQRKKLQSKNVYLISTGKKRGTLKFLPSSSLYLLLFSSAVICFGEESAVLGSVEYKGSLAMAFLPLCGPK